MLKLVQDLIENILWPAVLAVFIWLVFFIDLAYDLNLNHFGIQPKHIKGLRGILFSPFLHGDFGHLFSNTVPFLVSSAFVLHFFKSESLQIFGGIWLISGLGVWFYGESSSTHIGASGIVYGLVAFLLASGFIRKNKNLSAVALILIFLYGSMVWGLFPQYNLTGNQVSWQGHLFGAIGGIVMAIRYRAAGPQNDPDPFENEDDEEMPDWWKRMKAEEEIQEALIQHQKQQDAERAASSKKASPTKPKGNEPTSFKIVFKPKDTGKG